MKSPFVREIEPNQVVQTTFLVQHKEIRQKKSGDPYLSLNLMDRTGELDAKMWDNVAEVMETFERDDFVKVKGQLQIFNNRPQLTIHKMQRVGEADVDFADYFPASERNPDEMLVELHEVVEGMANSHLRGLLAAILDDHQPRAGNTLGHFLADLQRRQGVLPAAQHQRRAGNLTQPVAPVDSA